MKSKIKITNSGAASTVIDIEGMIGVAEEWQFDEPAGRVATYEKFQKALASIAKIASPEVVVNIRSTGGDVGDALLIHDALADLKNAVITTRCHGYVASAATIIAQAASEGRREISAGALYLVHNSIASCEGNAEGLRQSEELLAKTDQRIAAIYADRSGRPVEDFATLMAENTGNGRWLSPEETIAAGLADVIVASEKSSETTAKRWRKKPQNDSSADLLRMQQDIELSRLRQRISSLETENAQLQAAPTKTKTKEDPAPTESRLSANHDAYRRDVESFGK